MCGGEELDLAKIKRKSQAEVVLNDRDDDNHEDDTSKVIILRDPLGPFSPNKLRT